MVTPGVLKAALWMSVVITCEICVTNGQTSKGSKCPPVRPGQQGVCVESCSNDDSCPGDEICCSNGCGHQCTDPSQTGGDNVGRLTIVNLMKESKDEDLVVVTPSGNKTSWTGAQSLCLENGRQLVSIYSKDQNSALVEAAKTFCPKIDGEIFAHIGLQYVGAFNKFAWVSDPTAVRREALLFSNWGESEPRRSEEGQAVRMSVTGEDSSASGRWFTVSRDKQDTASCVICGRRARALLERPPRCLLPADTGPCRAAIPRWRYDPTNNKCVQFTYGGCDGNGNNFEEEQECSRECTGTTESPSVQCRLSPDAGLCLAYIPRWYYDPQEQRCKVFIYGGCPGNANRFASREDCEGRCKDVKGDVISTPPVAPGEELTEQQRAALNTMVVGTFALVPGFVSIWSGSSSYLLLGGPFDSGVSTPQSSTIGGEQSAHNEKSSDV